MLIHPRRSDLQFNPTAQRGSDRVDAARSAEFWDEWEEVGREMVIWNEPRPFWSRLWSKISGRS